MNFLAHSLISLEIDTQIKQQTLYGNFAGDFYKGLIPHLNLADNLKGGVVLHRLIDKISDRPDSLTTQLLQSTFGRYKGIVSDIMIDHFLAKNFQRLFAEDLNEVQAHIFQQIEQQRTIFPEQFVPMFNWLQSRKALTHYADLDFLERVFAGMASRVKKGDMLHNAVSEIKANYTLLEQASIQEFFTVKKKVINAFNPAG